MGGESGLFKADEDPKKGRWLETERALDYYGLKNGVRKGRGEEEGRAKRERKWCGDEEGVKREGRGEEEGRGRKRVGKEEGRGEEGGG